jgi:K+-sensing histidine kinase KdpD
MEMIGQDLQIICSHPNQTDFTLAQFNNHHAYLQYNKSLLEQSGLGLGLPLIQMACKLLNGTFSYQCHSDGLAHFTVRLPQNANVNESVYNVT